MTDLSAERTQLSGWGRYPTVKSRVVRPEKLATLQAVLEEDGRPVIARGAGRSYGDASLLNSGGTTLLTDRLSRMLTFDADTGVLRAEAGVRLREIKEVFLPGGISGFVREIELLNADGETVTYGPGQNEDLFWATVSGAGLTGMITEVALELHPIETAHVTEPIFRTPFVG